MNIIDSIVSYIGKKTGKNIIAAIVKGEIKNISINY